MCLKSLSGRSHLHVECHGFKFLWCWKCSSRNCSYWQVVNGAHLKWLPNKLWSRDCEVVFLVSMYDVLLWKWFRFLATINWHLSSFPDWWSRITHLLIHLTSKEIKSQQLLYYYTWYLMWTRVYKKENENKTISKAQLTHRWQSHFQQHGASMCSKSVW